MMELTEKEAFRLGFFKRAAERGYTPEQALALVKRSGAVGDVIGAVGKGLSGLGDVAAAAGKGGLLAAFGIPVLMGIGTGVAADKLRVDNSKADLGVLKRKQKLDELRAQTEAIRKRLAAKREAEADRSLSDATTAF